MENGSPISVAVIWRDKHINVEIYENSSIGDFGQKLLKLTKVKAETMRLLVPQATSKTSKLITPFSNEYSGLALREIFIADGKPIRMMGVFEYEVEEVSHGSMKADLRIRGFDEEEERLRQRLYSAPSSHLKLPQGSYIFCDFRTLHIPGIELNPPPSEALKRMHMLACDPGIVAIMNKHRWRVGIMTELAPVGYVGISPKCLLGFNKNCGEEISLRLRTDDLKGFRKYESIKKTLLHELAHMVHSEHDANFFALDKQLNQEAASLDWTKSASRTLIEHKITDNHDDVLHATSGHHKDTHKLGGRNSNPLINARQTSVAAAYGRILNSASGGLEEQLKLGDANSSKLTKDVLEILNKESIFNVPTETDSDSGMFMDDMQVVANKINWKSKALIPIPEGFKEPDPDDSLCDKLMSEPVPDDSLNNHITFEPGPDDGLDSCFSIEQNGNGSSVGESGNPSGEGEPNCHHRSSRHRSLNEPDPDDCEGWKTNPRHRGILRDMEVPETQIKCHQKELMNMEPDPDDGEVKSIPLVLNGGMECNSDGLGERKTMRVEAENDDLVSTLEDEELHRIEEPVAEICELLQKAIEKLRYEAPPTDASSSLQILMKIVRNVIDHPDEIKFRRLRKANPLIQKNVACFKAAMELLTVIGFCEDIVADEFGRMETYLVLRRNDPGLLWLAKSSLELSIS